MVNNSPIEKVGIGGVYVVHALKGYEAHEERLNKLFGQMGVPFEFVTDGDPASFTTGILDKYFVDGITDRLSTGVLSCTLNHILSYEKLVKNNNRFALVFENDPFFIGDFVEGIQKVAREAATLPPGFIVSLENTSLEFPPTRQLKKGKLLYPAARGRCAGAYLIDLQGAKAILQDLQTHKCGQVIDWWHNNLIDRGIIKMYWADPPLTEQGSHNGLMSSTISSKNRNTKRRVAWLLQKYYKTWLARWFK